MLRQSAALCRKLQPRGAMCAGTCPMYTWYRSNVAPANETVGNFPLQRRYRFQISVVSRRRLWHRLFRKWSGIIIGTFCQQVTGARRLGGAHHAVVMLKVIKDTFMAPQQTSPFFSQFCQTMKGHTQRLVDKWSFSCTETQEVSCCGALFSHQDVGF